MKTILLRTDSRDLCMASIAEGASLLRRGEVVAFPTETVYGLGGDGLNPLAIEAIFKAKGRPRDNPLILHIAKGEDLPSLVEEVPLLARELMKKFWPGPMTLIFKASSLVPKEITAGLDTVAIRMPSHPVARALIEATGRPIAAPSANRSGRPSPTLAGHVLEDMEGRIPLILDGGPTGFGLESTVIDVTVDPVLILRPGALTLEMVREVDPGAALDKGLAPGKTPKSPGQKYRHYAPKTPVVLVRDQKELEAYVKAHPNLRLGLMGMGEFIKAWQDLVVYDLGGDMETVSARLFQGLRALDKRELDGILAQAYLEEGVGLAVMNRLKKAARPQNKED